MSALMSSAERAVMYQPYPGGAERPEPSRTPGLPAAPTSITRAVRVMYAGAVASIIGIGIDFIGIGSLRSRIANANHKLTPAQVTNSEHVLVVLFIVGGLIAAALWVWMARSNAAGKSWARIVSTVLFALDTILQFVGLGAGAGAAGRIYAIVVWIIGLTAVILLWQRTSSEFFAEAKSP